MNSQISDLCTNGQCFHVLPLACQRFSKMLHAEVGTTLKTPMWNCTAGFTGCFAHFWSSSVSSDEDNAARCIVSSIPVWLEQSRSTGSCKKEEGRKMGNGVMWEDVLRLRRAYWSLLHDGLRGLSSLWRSKINGAWDGQLCGCADQLERGKKQDKAKKNK